MFPFDASALEHHRRLVARMAAGDAEALRQLYELHAARIHGIARQILRDPEEVREVVQDTFVKAWRQASRYRPERGEVIAWLVFIARHAAIDRLRQYARHQAGLSALPVDPVSGVPHPHETSDQREAIGLYLAQLSTAQRQALELAFFAGCTQAEIALRMQTPIGNVKNHLRRGLLKLRQLATRHE